MRIKKMSLYQQCAERLNAKGIKPFSAREWTTAIVQQTVYGKVNYPEVMEEITSIMIENNYEDWANYQFKKIKDAKSNI